LSIARAVFENPPIAILMKQPASILKVKNSVSRLRKYDAKHLLSIVMHTVSTIQKQTLLCHAKGKIVEQGTHDELIAHDGR
jgi:subfamily B ATP-binding cassette protein MsbA